MSQDNLETERNVGPSDNMSINRQNLNPSPLPMTNNKIFTIDDSENDGISPLAKVAPVRDFRDDLSISSDVQLRPHSAYRPLKRVLSTNVAPSVYLTPRRTNSSSDFQNYRHPKDGIRKNDNMVLKLVLPGGSPNLDNYYRTSSMEDIIGNGQMKDRHKQQTLGVNGLLDVNGGHMNRGYSGCSLNDLPNMMPNSPGVFSSTSTIPTAYKPDNPTPAEDKKKAFSDILVNTFSLFYALFIVTVGLAVYVADIIDGSHPTAEIFSLVIVSISFLYIIFLIVDISVFSHKKQKYQRLIEKNMNENNVNVTETPDGNFQFDIILPDILKKGKAISHDYCFNKDRHSTNFYLKVGAAAFCFGHLIHSGLLLGYQILFLSNDDHRFYQCASVPVLILDLIYPFYSFLLLYFIFKYSNVIINRRTVMARFGIMHCLSSSICFWVWTIMREVLEAVASKSYDYETTTTTDATDVTEPMRLQEPMALPLTAFTRKGADLLTESLNFTLRRFTAICDYNDASMVTIYRDISPYLYPFSVEFSILVVGVLYLVWQNISKCEAEDEDEASSTLQCKNFSGYSDNEEGNVVVHADCQASNKGLFGGFVVLVLTVVSSILFFIAVYGQNDWGNVGLTITTITFIIVLSTMLLACFLGYRQITKLDLNSSHHNLLDDVLLFICIPAFFLNGIFSIIPAIINVNALSIVCIILEIAQVLVQTAFLLDGVRRSSNTKKLRKLKPGRELVTFLIIANVSLWLMQTFEVKAHGLHDNRYEFYGKELWTILGHMCLPLMMFYRFHSSVCFGDVWKYAYQPSGH